MNRDILETKVETVESQLRDIELLLKKPLPEWTEEQREEYGDKAYLREEKRLLREEKLLLLRQKTGILSLIFC